MGRWTTSQTLSVSESRSSKTSYFKGGPKGLLTHPAEGAFDLDLRSEKLRLFPRAKALFNLCNGLQPLRWPLGEVVEALIVLVTFDGVEPSELCDCGQTHSELGEQTKKPNHVGPPIGSYLEYGEPKIFKDLDEERMQREPHSEFEVGLRQDNVTIQRMVRPFQFVGHDHLKVVLPCDSYRVLRSECKLEVLAADHYLILFLFTETTRSRRHSHIGFMVLLPTRSKATSGADSVEEVLGIETSLDRGSLAIAAKAAPK